MTGEQETLIRRAASVSQIMALFGMRRSTVEQKLKNCNPIRYTDSGRPIYDVAEAARYLVKPVLKLSDIKVEDLPRKVQDSYWAALLKKQKWEVNAGELWHTDKVRELFGTALQAVRVRLQILPEDIERSLGLSHEHYETVKTLVDRIQASIHDDLKKVAAASSTPSQRADEEDDLEEVDDDEGGFRRRDHDGII